MPPRFEIKIIGADSLKARLVENQVARPLVFTNGVFDILHRGHVTYLDAAAQLGSTLVVALNTDESVRRLGKGEDRPLNPLADRMAMVAALGCVDFVTWFDEDTPQAIIEALRPELIVKGGDYDMETLPETATVRSWGGDAVAIPFEFERSTSALLAKIRNAQVGR